MPETKVLFVDDEKMLLDMWSVILKTEGFAVTTAGSVPEALSRIASEKFDVLISDLNIGEPGDGFTVVSAMRRTQPHAATIILTGYPAFQAALRAIHEQVDDFLVKPSEPKLVVETIRQNLSRQRKAPALLTARLNDVIAQHKQAIIDEWYREVERHREISRIQIPREERIDDLPQVLDELVRAPAEEGKPRARSAAAEHGDKRRKQHYTIPMLLEETRILHRVIANCVQQNLLHIDVSNVIPDLMEVHDRMQRILQYALEAFLKTDVPRAA